MKRFSLTTALIGTWLLIAPGAARCQESVTLPETPVGKQVKRYLEVLAHLREAVAASRGG